MRKREGEEEEEPAGGRVEHRAPRRWSSANEGVETVRGRAERRRLYICVRATNADKHQPLVCGGKASILHSRPNTRNLSLDCFFRFLLLSAAAQGKSI